MSDTEHDAPAAEPVDPAAEALVERLARTSEKFFSRDELLARLPKKQLRIKFGVDATAPFLHIGHAVNLWMMRTMQEAGHKVVFLLGDFTTAIGDPTGKSTTRPTLSTEEINANAEEFLRQVALVLLTDPEVFEVRRNSEWFGPMPAKDLLGLLSSVTHSHLVSRDMFKARIANETPIYMHEMIYPILQGYDSVMLDSDLTIVGNDQLFNEMMGRYFQERAGQEPQVIITTRITPGTDGKEKQGKSLGNYIAITDTPRDKFGKTMSIPDEIVELWLEVYTEVPMPEVKELVAGHPRDAKARLATEIVARYHGTDAGQEELAWFTDTFSKRQGPTDIPTIEVPRDATMLDIAKVIRPDDSNRKLRDAFEGGGVKVDEVATKDWAAVPEWDAATVQIGKRSWTRVERTGG